MGISGLSGLSGLSGNVPGGARFWGALDDPTLRMWMDGGDPPTMALDGSNTVLSWTSKVGGHVWSRAGAAAVAYDAAGRFVLTSPAATGFTTTSLFGLSGDPNVTVLGVVDTSLLDSVNRLIIRLGEFTAGNYIVFHYNTSIERSTRYGNGSYVASAAPSGLQLFSMSDSTGVPSNVFFRTNGTSVAITSFAAPSTALNLNDTGILSNGQYRIYDLRLIESTNLATIQLHEGDLAWRHGLVGALPADHPYKLARPMTGDESDLDPDASAYIANVEAADGQPLEAGVRAAINEFVIGCKADPSPNAGVSNFQAIEASCLLMGARTLAGSLIPLKGAAPTNVGFIESQYSRTTGLEGDRSAYLNSNRNNNADPQDNNHNALYISSIGAGIALMGAGVIDAGTNSFLTSRLARNRSATGFTVSSLGAPSFFGTSRNSSAEFFAKGSGSVETASLESETPVEQNLFIFSRQTAAGAPNQTTSSRLCYYSIGRAVDLAALDARITALRNAIATALA